MLKNVTSHHVLFLDQSGISKEVSHIMATFAIVMHSDRRMWLIQKIWIERSECEPLPPLLWEPIFP